MKSCPSCGYENDESIKNCIFCGASMRPATKNTDGTSQNKEGEQSKIDVAPQSKREVQYQDYKNKLFFVLAAVASLLIIQAVLIWDEYEGGTSRQDKIELLFLMYSAITAVFLILIAIGTQKDSKLAYIGGICFGALVFGGAFLEDNLVLRAVNILLGLIISNYSTRGYKEVKRREGEEVGNARLFVIEIISIILFVVVGIMSLPLMDWMADAASPKPICGDGRCSGGESCKNCPADCSCIKEVSCGDGRCSGGESCKNCPADCSCEDSCGDGVCDENDLFGNTLCLKDCENQTRTEFADIIYQYAYGGVDCNGLDCVRIKDQIYYDLLDICVDGCGDGICDYKPCDLFSCPCRESFITCNEDCGNSWGETMGSKGYWDSYRKCDKDSDCVIIPDIGCTTHPVSINRNNTELIAHLNESKTHRYALNYESRASDSTPQFIPIVCDSESVRGWTADQRAYCASEKIEEWGNPSERTLHNVCSVLW